MTPTLPGPALLVIQSAVKPAKAAVPAAPAPPIPSPMPTRRALYRPAKRQRGRPTRSDPLDMPGSPTARLRGAGKDRFSCGHLGTRENLTPGALSTTSPPAKRSKKPRLPGHTAPRRAAACKQGFDVGQQAAERLARDTPLAESLRAFPPGVPGHGCGTATDNETMARILGVLKPR